MNDLLSGELIFKYPAFQGNLFSDETFYLGSDKWDNSLKTNEIYGQTHEAPGRY